MELGLKQKKALVCASSRGLGYAAAQSLAAEGCELFLCARNDQEVRDAAAALAREHQVKVHAMGIDLAAAGAVAKLKQAAVAAMGRVDILVNNVGGPAPSAAETTSEAAWRQGFDQLFISAVSLTQSLVPEMKERQFGRIVTITSLSVSEPIDHLAVSTAMRLAVTGFCKTLANEVAAHGITVNTVMPGVIHTQRIEDLRRARAEREGSTLAREMEKTAQQIPARRLGRPEELGALIAFLSSPLASYINGVNIPVDGGMRKGLI
jgi:3-oxoacyl-[acyl-carrier protein] reductase